MVDADRRPTAQEIEELIDLVRRDPGSPAFVDLGEAYLNLGRPKDAIGVGNLGLENAPDSLEGRVMIARAYAQLHQWKEAQAELLRVVKVDRSNRLGFALLGEVLLRRSDFERAVPVLQHAQNLDPTSPNILAMLKRARANQTLDPPPPIPAPVPPRGETSYGMQAAPPAQAAPPPRQPPAPMPAPQLSPQMPTLAINGAANLPTQVPNQALPPNDPPPPPPRPKPPTAPPPPPMSVEGVRPRIVSAAKPQNAAAASLRQSAAVGESYLNDLLTGGLLDVAGVRVPDSDFDLRPDRRWGRSTRRAFIFLFVVLVLGIGGGGTWYWWTEKKKAENIARYQKEAETAIAFGDAAGFKTADEKLQAAVKLDNRDNLTSAYSVEVIGLETLLYGSPPDTMNAGDDKAIKRLEADIQGDAPGARQLLVGKSALGLARLHTVDAKIAKDNLATIMKGLDAWLAKHDDDKVVRWLKGRAQIAQGSRRDGRDTIGRAAAGDDGYLIAMIDQADALVDDGHLDKALEIYDAALKKSKDHPLAILGRALGRAEAGIDVEAALNDLNDKFVDGKTAPRVTAYRSLARSLGTLQTEQYGKAASELKAAINAADPNPEHSLGDERFWTRVGWVYYTQGKLNQANDSVKYLHDYSAKGAEDYPPLRLLVAGNDLANGLPDRALSTAIKIDGVRSKVIRAQAYIDLGQYDDAIKEADEVTKLAQDNNDAVVLHEEARMLGNAKERTDAANALVALSRKLKTKSPLHALGYAYLTLGDAPSLASAKDAFTKALADISDDAPNPLAYRSETGLAQLAILAGTIDDAVTHINAALALNKKYFLARILQARVVLRGGDPERAMRFLDQLDKDTNGAAQTSPDAQFIYAEALASQKTPKQEDKDKAKAILVAIKDKVKPPEELGRVAALIDPGLPAELGVPAPTTPEAPPGGAPPKGGTPPKKGTPPKRR